MPSTGNVMVLRSATAGAAMSDTPWAYYTRYGEGVSNRAGGAGAAGRAGKWTCRSATTLLAIYAESRRHSSRDYFRRVRRSGSTSAVGESARDIRWHAGHDAGHGPGAGRRARDARAGVGSTADAGGRRADGPV